jgi:hypothetical protein
MRLTKTLKSQHFSSQMAALGQRGGTAMDDKLVPKRSELATLGGISLTPSETALLKQVAAKAL